MAQLASAPALGAGGRRFKSFCPDGGNQGVTETWLLVFMVSSHIQPLKLPKEWKNNKELSDMVAFFNYMEIMHAIETDYDCIHDSSAH